MLLTVIPCDSADDRILLPRDAVAGALRVALRTRRVVLARALGVLDAAAILGAAEMEQSPDLRREVTGQQGCEVVQATHGLLQAAFLFVVLAGSFGRGHGDCRVFSSRKQVGGGTKQKL